MRPRSTDVAPDRSVATFDVFDTVLTRAVGSPRGLFLLLGRQMAAEGVIPCDAVAFTEARLRADRHAYARWGRGGPVGVDLISRELALALHLDGHARQTVLRAELALEALLSRLVPQGARAVEAARADGRPVRFLSDMYLPSAFIEAQLRHHGVWRSGDRLLVSGEAEATKRNGALYRLAAGLDGCRTDQLTHRGNDRRGDVVSARRAGLTAVHQPEANPTPDEVALDRHADRSGGLATALAGAARMARLTVPAGDAVAAARRDVTADVIGPLLIGYVLWLLHRAVDLGLERVCFLARDGQVLLDIAQRLQPRLDAEVADLKLSYLHASRQAWNIAAVDGPVGPHLPWLLSHSQEASAQALLERLALSTADPEVAEALDGLGLPRSRWEEVLDASTRALLMSDLGAGRLARLAQDAAAAHRLLVVDQLRQQGVFKGACGLVDVVARGTQHRAVVGLAELEGAEAPHGFLMGIQRDDSMPAAVRGRMHAWLYDDNAGVGVPDHRPLDVLSIAACAADHGTLLGYRRGADGAVRPVLRSVEDSPVAAWGLAQVRQTLAAMTDALVLDQPAVSPGGDVRDAVARGVRRLWDEPTPLEAQAWGSYPYEHGSGAEPRYAVLAPPATWRSTAQRLAGRDDPHWTWWPAAARARGPAALRHGRQALTRPRSLRRRLRDRP